MRGSNTRYHFLPESGSQPSRPIRGGRDEPVQGDIVDRKRAPCGDRMGHGQEDSIAILACERAG